MKKLGEILSGPETWTQLMFGLPHGPRHCLVGAVMVLRGDQYQGPTELLRLRHAIEDATGEAGADPMLWNDKPLRTWDHVASVVEAYDRAALLDAWRTA